MIGLLIMALIAVGVVSAAGYAAFMLVRAGDDLQSAQANRAALEAAAAMVRASLRTVRSDGVPYAPMGSEITHAGATYTTLPGWLTQGAVTPWGVPFAYCPLAPSSIGAGTAATVRTTGAGSPDYAVQTVGWTAAGAARPYVVRSPALAGLAAAPPVAALIVAPRVGGEVPPDCTTVTFAGGRFQVEGGLVAAVLRDAAVSAAANDAVARLVRFVAPAPTGDGSGLDPDNRATLAEALGAWAALLPAAMTVDLAAGDYALDPCAADSATAASQPGGRGRKLTLRGAGAGSTRIAAAAPPAGCSLSAVALRAPADLEVTGVTFASAISLQPLPGTQLTVADVSVGSILAKGADVLVLGNLTAAGDSGPGLHVDGGRLRVANAGVAASSASQAGLSARGAQVSIEGATVLASGAPGILLEGSRTTLTSSSVTASGGGFALQLLGGDLDAWGSALAFNTGPFGWGLAIQGGGAARLHERSVVTQRTRTVGGAVLASGAAFSMDTESVVDALAGASVQSGVRLESGHLTVSLNSSVGVAARPPLVGVVDAGGAGVAGAGGSIYGQSACVSGAMFAAKPGGAYGPVGSGLLEISSENTDAPWKAVVRATWNCNG